MPSRLCGQNNDMQCVLYMGRMVDSGGDNGTQFQEFYHSQSCNLGLVACSHTFINCTTNMEQRTTCSSQSWGLRLKEATARSNLLVSNNIGLGEENRQHAKQTVQAEHRYAICSLDGKGGGF